MLILTKKRSLIIVCFHLPFREWGIETRRTILIQNTIYNQIEAQHPFPQLLTALASLPFFLKRLHFLLHHPHQCPRLYPFIFLPWPSLTLYRGLSFPFPEFCSRIRKGPIEQNRRSEQFHRRTEEVSIPVMIIATGVLFPYLMTMSINVVDNLQQQSCNMGLGLFARWLPGHLGAAHSQQ